MSCFSTCRNIVLNKQTSNGVYILIIALSFLKEYVKMKISNMLTQEEKEKIIKKYKLHETDTGSAEVQIAITSEEIKRLTLHLKKHSKDLHSKRGLLKMVMKRKKLLNYLKKENTKRYNTILKKIGLK